MNTTALQHGAENVDAALNGLQKASLAPPNIAIVSGDGVEPLVDVVDGRELQWVRGRSATTRASTLPTCTPARRSSGVPPRSSAAASPMRI
jgi:hypothetical protein